MRNIAALITISALLQGCASTSNCVAVVNPNETIVQGKVIAKSEAQDITLTDPKGKVIDGEDATGAMIAMGTLGLGGAVGAVGVAYLSSLKSKPVTPSVGGDCGGSSRELEHGWLYTVAAEDNQVYSIPSAYGGFDTNECVRLYIARDGERLTGRIAKGGSCEHMP